MRSEALLATFLIVLVWSIGFLALTGTVWGFAAGWYRLARRFPDRREPALVHLRGLSGLIGWVSVRDVLSLTACESGLRVAVWRTLCPWAKPFLVPWGEIQVELVGGRGSHPVDQVRLTFGAPAGGRLTIDPGVWKQVSAKAPD